MANTNRKRCPRCLRLLPLSRFRFRDAAKRKRQGYCKTCQLKYYKEYNKKRYKSAEARQAELDRGHQKYLRLVRPLRILRKAILVKLLGGECAQCGYKRSAAALDFDHTDPTTKRRTVSSLLTSSEPEAWRLAVEETQFCQLLCSNCHREKTYPERELTAELEAHAQELASSGVDRVARFDVGLLLRRLGES